jgi:uncharacterized membrane protein
LYKSFVVDASDVPLLRLILHKSVWFRKSRVITSAATINLQQPDQSKPSIRAYRLASLDTLRGLLMLLMAIDHVRDYFSNVTIEPEDPLHSWPALFATRWITHLCAPGFILLAGASIYLQRRRKSPAQLTRILLLRGLWLIFVEIFVVTFGWLYGFGTPFLQVIWAIGLCMMVMAALQWLPISIIAGFGAITVLGHDLFDRVRPQSLGLWANAWRIIHSRGPLVFHGHRVALVVYPIVPWIGVMALGYCFGQVLTKPAESRQRYSVLIGLICLVAFTILRALHGYGDPGSGFQHLGSPERTAMSFLSAQKYPPSLHFLLATLGVVLLLFALTDKLTLSHPFHWMVGLLKVYGRVPFLFYVAHIYLAHALALIVTAATHGDWRFWVTPAIDFSSHLPGWGYSLPIVYLFWLVVIAALYLPCAWFGQLKDRHSAWWLTLL